MFSCNPYSAAFFHFGLGFHCDPRTSDTFSRIVSQGSVQVYESLPQQTNSSVLRALGEGYRNTRVFVGLLSCIVLPSPTNSRVVILFLVSSARLHTRPNLRRIHERSLLCCEALRFVYRVFRRSNALSHGSQILYRELSGTHHELFGVYDEPFGRLLESFGRYCELFGRYHELFGVHNKLFARRLESFGRYRELFGRYHELFGMHDELFGRRLESSRSADTASYLAATESHLADITSGLEEAVHLRYHEFVQAMSKRPKIMDRCSLG